MKKISLLVISVLLLCCNCAWGATTPYVIDVTPNGVPLTANITISYSTISINGTTTTCSKDSYIIRQSVKDSVWKHGISISSDFRGTVYIDTLNISTGGTAIDIEGPCSVIVDGGKYISSSAAAVKNTSTGTVNLLGGTFHSSAYSCITNASTGLLYMGGGADTTYISSAATDNSLACVYQYNAGTSITNRIYVQSKTKITATGQALGIFNGWYGGTLISGAIIDTKNTAVHAGGVTITGGYIHAKTGYGIVPSGPDDRCPLTISGGTVTSDSSYAICSASSAPILITGGLVTAPYRAAIWNNNANVDVAPIRISGGTVHSSSYYDPTIVNMKKCNIYITGGYLTSDGFSCLDNNVDGIITVGGGTDTAHVICRTVSDPADEYCALYQNSNGNGSIKILDKALVQGINGSFGVKNISTSGSVIMSGGIVTSDTGNGISTTYGSGSLTISGGSVSSGTGKAVYNTTKGTTTITGGTITSGSGSGVYNYSTGAVNISAGSISSTSSNAIYNTSSGSVSISGGTIASTSGYGINNSSTGSVTISSGSITSGSSYAIYNGSTGAVTLTGGTLASTSGKTIYCNSTGVVTINGVAISRTWTGTYPYYINGNYNSTSSILGSNYATVGMIGSAETTARTLGYKFTGTTTQYTRGTSVDATGYVKSASSTVNIINPTTLAVLTITQPTNGSILATLGTDTVVSGAIYLASDAKTITLKATPANGYKFSSWTGSSNIYGNPSTVVMSADKTIAVTFSATTTNLDENGYDTKAAIYPNPVAAGSSLKVTTGGNSTAYELYNVNGLRIESGVLDGNNSSIQAPSVAGVYLITIKGGNNTENQVLRVIVK